VLTNNSILWGNTHLKPIRVSGPAPTLAYCDIEVSFECLFLVRAEVVITFAPRFDF
jgi:hypothetical protein